MRAWRVLGTVAGLLFLTPSGWGQSGSLAEPLKADDSFKIELEMKLTGEIRIVQPDGAGKLKLEASANHVFPERVLAVGSDGLPEKTARLYETARARITVGSDPIERTLRPDRRLLVAQRHKDQTVVYTPKGPLTSDELELTGQHFDTLVVLGLLAGKEVNVGDKWKVPGYVAQSLCTFEGLTKHDLTGKLEEIKDGLAIFSIAGTANGIDAGAAVESTIQATGRFDLSAKRLVRLEWKQTDKREQGPVSPASTVQSWITLSRSPIEQPEALSDVALVSVPPDKEPPGVMLNLEHRDSKGRFALAYPRDWHITGQTPDHLVMRLLDRGDFVAQATIAPFPAAAKGKHMSPAAFAAAMAQTPGWEPEAELQAGEVDQGKDRYVYRLSVTGKLEGIPVEQTFYLVASPDGDQVVVTFTMTPKQVSKLGARDLSLVGSLEVPASDKEPKKP
jgi:hypothetical protein